MSIVEFRPRLSLRLIEAPPTVEWSQDFTSAKSCTR